MLYAFHIVALLSLRLFPMTEQTRLGSVKSALYDITNAFRYMPFWYWLSVAMRPHILFREITFDWFVV